MAARNEGDSAAPSVTSTVIHSCDTGLPFALLGCGPHGYTRRPSLGSSPALGVHFRMGADTLLLSPWRTITAFAQHLRRKVPGTAESPRH